MKDTVLSALRMFGLDREVSLFQRAFSQFPPHRFAVIKISGKTLEDSLGTIAQDLAFLSSLGLTPVVVHGGGSQIDRELEKHAIKVEKASGLRVTDKRTMRVVRKVLNRISSKLVSAINKKGGRAINANDLHAVRASKMPPVNGTDLKMVGNVESVDTAQLKSLCKSGFTPVLASMAEGPQGWYNVNADTLAKHVVLALKPQKFILITSTGGILDKDGKIISTIDVEAELPELIRKGVITEGMRVKVEQTRQLLQEVPQSVVEICSPQSLLQELFTVKGSGTLLRSGANLRIMRSMHGLNKTAIRNLLEESFGKKLIPHYFKEPVELAVCEKTYSGIAIVKKLNSRAYLDKFAISKKAQSTGLAKIIWHEVKEKHASLVWRSTIHNPVNPWYLKQADGAQKSGEWIVFWYGTKPDAATIKKILHLPKTLVKT